MNASASYGGAAGNWTRTGADWGVPLRGAHEDSLGLSKDAWAATAIALGSAGLCVCATLLCWRWRAGRAVEVAVRW
jgi:hypothetical protein